VAVGLAASFLLLGAVEHAATNATMSAAAQRPAVVEDFAGRIVRMYRCVSHGTGGPTALADSRYTLADERLRTIR
jgi:hypothetical protein